MEYIIKNEHGCSLKKKRQTKEEQNLSTVSFVWVLFQMWIRCPNYILLQWESVCGTD